VNLFRDLDDLTGEFRGGAVAIGNFDGPHLGHARIIERLRAMADRVGGPAVAFTFDPPPSRILRPEAAPVPLSWIERKAELLCRLGAGAVIAFPTTAQFLQLEARQFFDQIVRRRLDARAMVEGRNFFFGHNRGGSVEVLRQFCGETGLLLEVVGAVEINGQAVSSSRVRDLIAAGDVAGAHVLLGRPYRIRGTVVRGAGRGRTLGFPTANLGGVDTLLPGEGIYAGRALADDGVWPAAVSLGPNPTFHEGATKAEVHLIGYEGTLYDRSVAVDFLARLREVRRFESVDLLLAQMAQDVAVARRVAEEGE
jgi:riboflavin kinase/FMN adenylyltransferase